MLTSHSPPIVTGVTVVGTGAAIITDPAKLTAGRPAAPTRLRWLSAATPATTDVVSIQFTFAQPFVPGLLGLFGFRPFGMLNAGGFKFAFNGKLSGGGGFTYALGGNTGLQRSIKRSDRSIAALGACDFGLSEIVAAEMEIWNDQNGVATLTPSQFVDLGGFWSAPAFDLDIDGDWDLSPQNSTPQDSVDDQPWPAPYPPGRLLTWNKTQMSFSDAYIDGANPCIQSLHTIAGNGDPSVMVPRWKDDSGVLSPANLHATAVFGIANFGKIARGKSEVLYNTTGCTSKEIPALGA